MTNQKPIRKDRVALALLFLLAVILLPILIRSGGHSPAIIPTTEVTTTEVPPLATETPATTPTTVTEEPATTEPTATEPTSTQVETILTHQVAAGETLDDIASSLGVTPAQLLADNRLFSAAEIVPGMTLRAVPDGILHKIEVGQTLTDISKTYGVSIDEITRVNNIVDPGRIYAGEEIIIPGASPSLWETVIHLAHGKKTRFIWPLDGKVVSEFGWRTHPVLNTRHHHNGIDIDVPTGTIVHAAAPGKVYFAGEDKDLSGYGTLVILQHADDYFTFYGHLSKIDVYTGQFVMTGQPIAESGNTGLSSGPHLHFEIRNGEFPVDPRRYLP